MLPDPKRRRAMIIKHYKRKPLHAKTVYKMIRRSIAENKAISVIRLGDVMGKLLARKKLDKLREVAPFLGIPYPPPPELYKMLDKAVLQANVVGLTHFPQGSVQLRRFMKRHKWTPRHIADSFINDLMYDSGLLHRLIQRHRVLLVGRSAQEAAKQLRKNGFPVAGTVDLAHYGQLPEVMRELSANSGSWDLAMVGASVPGRILCVHIARRLNKTAIEIGHMMDAFANPGDWKKHHDRKQFKQKWMEKLKKETPVIVSSPRTGNPI